VTTLHPVRPAPADHSSPDGVLPGADLLADLLAGTALDEQPVTHVHHVPVRESRTDPWPGWVPADLRDRLLDRGVREPWRHQVEAAELAHSGRSVVVATGTASGKSLAYQLPALARLADDPRACVLYLAPTKALARDQLAAVAALADPSVRPAAYDGDTPQEERDWVLDQRWWAGRIPRWSMSGFVTIHRLCRRTQSRSSCGVSPS
jgi:DEAD/DEAH box helicase domain-containing protein